MADMLKTTPPLFGPRRPNLGWSIRATKPTTPSREHGARPTNFAPLRHGGLEDADAQLRRALANSGRRLLLRHFLNELSKLLDQQEGVLAMLDSAQARSLPLLNRQFYAVRTAAEGLELQNLAQVAGRAEVLVNLIDSGELAYERNHGTVIRETHRLLRTLVSKVLETDSDDACYSLTQIAWSMHAALDPALCEYAPGEHAEQLVAQSTEEPDQRRR